MDTIKSDLKNDNENDDGSIGQNTGNQASIGSLLRASRIRINQELTEVSATLRIRQVYLEAIENNNFDVLPGVIYAIGFIRTYSDYLGLDSEEIIRRHKTQTNITEKKQDLIFPSLVPEHSIPGSSVVILGLVLCVFVYGSWYFVSSEDNITAEQVSAVPERLAYSVSDKPADTEILGTTKESQEQWIAPLPEGNNKEISAGKAIEDIALEKRKTERVIKKIFDDDSAKLVEKKVAKVETPKYGVSLIKMPDIRIKPVTPKLVQEASTLKLTSEPKPITDSVLGLKVKKKLQPKAELKLTSSPKKEPLAPDRGNRQNADNGNNFSNLLDVLSKPAPATTLATTGISRITLRAISDSYIQVRDNDADKLLITRLLKKGQSYQVPDRSGLSLITGNAGALKIIVDGIAVPSIGPIGTVLRNVTLDPKNLSEGSAVIE